MRSGFEKPDRTRTGGKVRPWRKGCRSQEHGAAATTRHCSVRRREHFGSYVPSPTCRPRSDCSVAASEFFAGGCAVQTRGLVDSCGSRGARRQSSSLLLPCTRCRGTIKQIKYNTLPL